MFKEKAFTMIEILVVIAIIGILATIVLVNMSGGREKAKIAKAQSELRHIHLAIFNLEGDTGQWPGHKAPYVIEDIDDNEICDDGCAYGLTASTSGLLDTDGSYTNWRGPYYTGTLIDPWGHEYFFDTDYDIGSGTTKWVVAIGSYGPNGAGLNSYDDDDIIYIIPSQ